MTQENKELLWKDLCARLPYGVKCCVKNNHKISGDLVGIVGENVYIYSSGHAIFSISDIKLYLLPLSSMTDEQYDKLYIDSRVKEDSIDILDALANDMDAIHWLNKNHFDYRGLIEKGLAIDATNLNIY